MNNISNLAGSIIEMKNIKYNICDEGHATESIVYLLLKEGGKMDYRRLMSLLYISERMCIDIKRHIFCNASLAITPDGPVVYGSNGTYQRK